MRRLKVVKLYAVVVGQDDSGGTGAGCMVACWATLGTRDARLYYNLGHQVELSGPTMLGGYPRTRFEGGLVDMPPAEPAALKYQLAESTGTAVRPHWRRRWAPTPFAALCLWRELLATERDAVGRWARELHARSARARVLQRVVANGQLLAVTPVGGGLVERELAAGVAELLTDEQAAWYRWPCHGRKAP